MEEAAASLSNDWKSRFAKGLVFLARSDILPPANWYEVGLMRMKVDIVHGGTADVLQPLVLCTFFFDGKHVTCTNETFLKLANAMGVVGDDGRTYFPRDGMAFLHALPALYHGPHLTALPPEEA